MPRSSVSSIRAAALGLPRHERLQDPLRLREMLGGRRDVAPAVHRPAGHALEDHDLAGAARRQRREDEVLPHARDDVEADGRELRPRRHPGHVREGERAHRLVELRALCVALEELRDRALAGRDDHEVAVGGVPLEVVEARLVEDELAAARCEVLHPARELDALIDGLRQHGRGGRPSRSPSHLESRDAARRGRSPRPEGRCRPRSRSRAHARCRARSRTCTGSTSRGRRGSARACGRRRW